MTPEYRARLALDTAVGSHRRPDAPDQRPAGARDPTARAAADGEPGRRRQQLLR